MRIVYFVQDLSDPAVGRRVKMLSAGGAKIDLFGFRRSGSPISAIAGVAAVDLGRTSDGRLGGRAALILWWSLRAHRWRKVISRADAILARNLEMATLADAARIWAGSSVPLIYECLDIHGSLLKHNIVSKLMRAWEKRVLDQCAGLMISSPGFRDFYFDRLGIRLPSIVLVENKCILLGAGHERPEPAFDAAAPWRIGWFGNIRCARSFHMLWLLAKRYPDLVDVDVRGRPTHELQDLIARNLPLPNMRFSGVYVQADLPAVYGAVHLTWAVDYFQRGGNSDWLLPNRIYEGGFYNRPAIAVAGTETARWLEAHRTGVSIHGQEDLEMFFNSLSSTRYAELQRSAAAVATSDLADTLEDCRQLTSRIARSRDRAGAEILLTP